MSEYPAYRLRVGGRAYMIERLTAAWRTLNRPEFKAQLQQAEQRAAKQQAQQHASGSSAIS